MANIVFAMHNFLLRPNSSYACPLYYSSFVNGLLSSGNNILCFNINYRQNNNTEEIPQEYLSKIKNFSPDLFIFSDNQFWDVSNYFDVPIVFLNVDSLEHFRDIDKIKKNPNRYFYFEGQIDSINKNIKLLNCKESKILLLRPFTEIKSDNKIIPDINISFLGSHWIWKDFLTFTEFADKGSSKEERDIAFEAFNYFKSNPLNEIDEFYKKYPFVVNKLEFNDIKLARARIAGIKRLRFLTEIADLGLEVRGTNWTTSVMLNAFPEVMLHYSKQPTSSADDVSLFYNRSKLSINTKHLQATTGFSWRVMDILASNACLVTEYAEDLQKIGFDFIPTFKTEKELRPICVELLSNETLRNKIVKEANTLINQKFRFKHVLLEIENFLNMDLHSNCKGTLDNVLIYGTRRLNFPNFPSCEYNRLSAKNKLLLKISKYFYCKIKHYKNPIDFS